MKTPNYKLLFLNMLLRLPFVLLARTAAASWVALKTTGKYIAAGYRAIFNRRNAVRVRRAWRLYRELSNDLGDWMVDKVFFKGKVGFVNFNLMDGDIPDGYLVLREFGDKRMVEIGYRIENRWLTTRDGLPRGYVMSTIRTQAIEQGFNVAYVKWGNKLLMPYVAPALSLKRCPDDVVIPSEELWTPVVEFPQYKCDPLARNSAVLHRC